MGLLIIRIASGRQDLEYQNLIFGHKIDFPFKVIIVPITNVSVVIPKDLFLSWYT